LAESCLAGGSGAIIKYNCTSRPELELFGEGPSRVLVSVSPELGERVKSIATESGIPVEEIGIVQGDLLQITSGSDSLIEMKIALMERAYREVFTWIME